MPHTQFLLFQARIDKVHVDGVGRTKDDLVQATVQPMFEAATLEDVITRTHEARTRLEQLGCFRSVGVLIDTSRGPDATEKGLEVSTGRRREGTGGQYRTPPRRDWRLLPDTAEEGLEVSIGHRREGTVLAAAENIPRLRLLPPNFKMGMDKKFLCWWVGALSPTRLVWNGIRCMTVGAVVVAYCDALFVPGLP